MDQTINTSQPQTQEAVVDALHENNLGDDEDWIPDIAAEMTAHLAGDEGDKHTSPNQLDGKFNSSPKI